MKNECYFCNLVNLRNQIIRKYKYFILILDSYPVSPGHVCIISKRHTENFCNLTNNEWIELRNAIKWSRNIHSIINLKIIYKTLYKHLYAGNSKYFLYKVLNNPNIGRSPDGYNYGINENEAAGMTIKHFHFHVIPRFNGDIYDPTGGIRRVLGDLSNYKLPRN